MPFLVVQVSEKTNRNSWSCRRAEIQSRFRRLIHDKGRDTVAYGLNFRADKVL